MFDQQYDILDVTVHKDPKEFVGKGLIVYDTAYLVSGLIGSGEEKFVYSLKNLKSGLELLVLKVYRERTILTAYERLARSLFEQQVRDGNAYEDMSVPGNGNRLELQRRGGLPSAAPRTDLALIEAARTAISEERYDNAVLNLDRVLASYPYHTDALMLKAEVYSSRGEEWAAVAVDVAMAVIGIEPNFLPYLSSAFRMCLKLNAYERARLFYQISAAKYPYVYEFTLDMTSMHLAHGEAHAAATTMASLPLDAPHILGDEEAKMQRLRELDEEIISTLESELAGRRHAAVAHRLLRSRPSDLSRVIESAEKAHQMAPQSPTIKASLGLVMAQAGRYDRAGELLVEAAESLRGEAEIACLMNAAFCRLEASDSLGARTLYGDAMALLVRLKDSEGIVRVAGIPLHARWIDMSEVPYYFPYTYTIEVLERVLPSYTMEEAENFYSLLDLLRQWKATDDREYDMVTQRLPLSEHPS